MKLIKLLKEQLDGNIESMIFLHSISEGIEMFEFVNSEELRMEHSVFYEEELKSLKSTDDVTALIETVIPEIYDEETSYLLIESKLDKLNEFNGIQIKDTIKTDCFEKSFIEFYNGNKNLIGLRFN